ncbi:DUF983 domain-containing protein [Oceanicella sp. SM1341]|uniref:DUF983 domain-containing protein n=1 Tax=Oceanicella sp. SM1341 TaxID=1548889 RepID=UPI000E4C2F61|nr:DUF983 domain-containing protein [Oceanicella sp. SM1341]
MALTPDLTPDPATREVKPALLRGLRCRCPRCGEGKVFDGYIRVAKSCSACGLDLTKQRADDGPAYIVILIVGHIMGLMMLELSTLMRDSPFLVAGICCAAALGLAIPMLPRVKGAFIAYQWAKGLHGF